MRVYVIIEELEDSCKVIGVTCDKEQAEQICKYSNEIKRTDSLFSYHTCDTDEFIPFSQGKMPYSVHFFDDGSYRIDKASYSTFAPNNVWFPREGSTCVDVYASDEKDAWKLANEVLAAYKQSIANEPPSQETLEFIKKLFSLKRLTDEEAKEFLYVDIERAYSDYLAEVKNANKQDT